MYRFDDNTQKVYCFDINFNDYVFIGSYLMFGIFADMPDAMKTNIVNSFDWD